MPEVLPENGLTSTLTSAIAAAATSISIQGTDASFWPASGEYRVVLWQDATNGPWELVKIVSGQGTATLGVERAAEPYHGTQVARDWPAGAGTAAVLTKAGLNGVFSGGGGGPTIQTYDVVPAASATTVTLPGTAASVFLVARNGVIQSVGAGHYTVAGSVLTFASSFSGADRVVVSYTVGTPSGIQTDDLLPAASATTATLSLTPDQVFMVARNGVIQSVAAGHYTVSGNVVTFAAPFNGTDRMIASYTV